MATKSRTRLSLTELLILLLIGATMVSIGAPALDTLSSSADLAKCRGNLYLLGAASHLYASENEGKMPGANVPTTISMSGTFVADGRMYARLLPTAAGGYGDTDYLSTPHPLLCPSLSPAVYASPGYSRPEQIDESNPITRMGYAYLFYSASAGSPPPNDTIQADPNAPLCIDFGWTHFPGSAGLIIGNPSHPNLMNVLHLDGHLSTFPLDQANNINAIRNLYEALRTGTANP